MLEVESNSTLSVSENLQKLKDKDDQIEDLLIKQLQLESKNNALEEELEKK